MDWNKFVKAIGDYHGIECDPVETMEEADIQLAELYAKESPAITGKLITGAEWDEYQELKAKSQESKPPANADMVEELEAYCKMVRKALTGGIHESHVSQIEKILSKYRPVKANDEGVE